MYATVRYKPRGKPRRIERPAETCTAVYPRRGETATEALARFLRIQPNETRRELSRLKTENLLVPRESVKDKRLQRYVRLDDGTYVRGYILKGDESYWLRDYRPPPSHERRKDAPRKGRMLAPFKW